MSFTESVLSRTKLIEKLLIELGGTGTGLYERAKSLPTLPGDILPRLRDIAWVRNNLVHQHDFCFGGDEQLFLSVCDAVIARLSALSADLKGGSPSNSQVRPAARSLGQRLRIVGRRPSQPDSTLTTASPKDTRPENTALTASNATSAPPPEKPVPTTARSSGLKAAFLAAVLCLIPLPFVCTRSEKHGIWPFYQVEKVTDWKQVGLWTAGISLATLLIARRSPKNGP